ncbi:MAG TPA: Hpt domain-containing protein [Bryobacteraceae bacterium]|nr:Hpt domain-containing protein [Bryobacteraceae bacterium]
MESNTDSDVHDAWILPAALRQLQECGETALVEELIAIFQTDTAARLETLARAVAASDYAVARQEAHTIKGSALQVGAVRFADFCRQMELEARKPDPADLAPLLSAAVRSFDEVRSVFAARGSGMDGSPHNGQ